ncbi:MAG: hypothetical protein RL681_879 [Candidatus Parcubacteria bacterium]|jgi:ABC-type Mn2+/Zn2+ transport system permease subunit
MLSPETYPFILAVFVATATGLMGGFALMKRMTLAGDTMSHIALPGLGLAFLWNANPIVGAAAALGIGAVIIWKIESHADLSTETSVGVIFAASIAIGALVTPSEDIIEALFGGSGGVSFATLVTYIALSLAVVFFVMRFRNRLVLSLFNADLASASGVNVSRTNLFYLLTFALTLVLGLRFLGTLLVGALVIVPAAISRQLTHTLDRFLWTSAAASVFSVLLGYGIADLWDLDPEHVGPAVVAVGAGLFVISLLKKKR